jgi:hypothetical protein
MDNILERSLFFFHYSVREILMVEGLGKGDDYDSNLSLFGRR